MAFSSQRQVSSTCISIDCFENIKYRIFLWNFFWRRFWFWNNIDFSERKKKSDTAFSTFVTNVFLLQQARKHESEQKFNTVSPSYKNLLSISAPSLAEINYYPDFGDRHNVIFAFIKFGWFSGRGSCMWSSFCCIKLKIMKLKPGNALLDEGNLCTRLPITVCP